METLEHKGFTYILAGTDCGQGVVIREDHSRKYVGKVVLDDFDSYWDMIEAVKTVINGVNKCEVFKLERKKALRQNASKACAA